MTEKDQAIEHANEVMSRKLAKDIESKKADEYEQVTEEFLNDELSDEEYDAALDNLFNSGDDFLEYADLDESEESERLDNRIITVLISTSNIFTVEMVRVFLAFAIIVSLLLSLSGSGVFIIPTALMSILYLVLDRNI